MQSETARIPTPEFRDGTGRTIRRLDRKLRQIHAHGKTVMPMIAVLLMSSLVTLIAVIGLADAVTHLLCWTARSLKNPEPVSTARSSIDMAGRGRLAA
jgi:hypothetical protein